MKAQVLTIAAMVLAANVSFAANSTQSTSTASFDSLESIVNHAASTSNRSVQASTSTGNGIENLATALKRETTQDFRAGGVLMTAAGSVSAIGAFVVTGVQVSVQGATKITDITLKGAVSGSQTVLRVTEKYVAQPSAQAVDSTAQAAWDGTKYVAGKAYDGAKYVGQKTINVGKGVYVGLSASGSILIEETNKASHQAVDSHSLTSGAILLGSISLSSQAFGSKVRQGFTK